MTARALLVLPVIALLARGIALVERAKGRVVGAVFVRVDRAVHVPVLEVLDHPLDIVAIDVAGLLVLTGISVVALILGSTAIVGAAPVQAAQPSFGFSLNFGNSGKAGITLHFGDKNYFKYCLSNSQIRSALRHKGYSDVRIVRESNNQNKVWAVGRKHGDWFSMRVDRCSGKVDRVREIHRNRNGSFNLSFSF